MTGKRKWSVVLTAFSSTGPENRKGERLFTRSLAIALGVRDYVARGVFVNATLQWFMTLAAQTFQENFLRVVSEDLLDYTERIFLDKLVGARLRHATQLHLIISRTQHFSSDREWNNVLLTLSFDS